jgi:hypothetical protein
MLRITQTGNGHSLVVEDNTNPDTSSFIVANNGSVAIGRDPATYSPSNAVLLDVAGKANFTPTATFAGINIGTTTTPPTSLANGDIWIGNALNFRDQTGASRACVVTNTSNTISANTSVNPILTVSQTGNAGALAVTNAGAGNALRITHTGLGKAVIIEDETSPDGSSTVIDQNGSVGIGVATTFTATHKLEVVGAVKANSITFDGTAQFKVNSVADHGGGPNTHDLYISYNGSTYRIPMIFVSTP